MKYLFFLCTMSFYTLSITAQNASFSRYFKEGSLRIDFLFYGNSQKEAISIHRLKKEPHFGGGTSHQLYFPNYGNYNILVRDAQEQNIIFSKGFSSLFDEWQATAEAEQINKTFEHSIQIPFPKQNIIIEIQHRNHQGSFSTLFSQSIAIDDYNIIQEKVTPYPVRIIQKSASKEKAVDIAIIAEGYTQKEMAKFIADAQKLTNYLFTIPPFDQHKKQFNIYAIQSPSVESGTDIPGQHIYKNTLLNASFYTFGQERYLTTNAMFTIADVAANVPYDQIYVLVNTPKYGGGAFYNTLNLVSANNELSNKVFVHEFGHGFVGLGDEYYNTTNGSNEYYNLCLEPWEPNITTLINFDSKWKKHIKKNTPIPTPRTARYKNVVGVFEGGGYVPKGIYSPVQDCRMKSNEPEGFCPVCSEAIRKTILFYTK